MDRQIADYASLKTLLQDYCLIIVLDFDPFAAREFESLMSSGIKVGTMDLKIASIAIANNATLVTRNLSDFGKIPILKITDWSA